MTRYLLLIAGRRTPVEWSGRDGLDACQRYADAHPGSAVTAWREAPVYVVTVHPSQIIG